MTQNNPYLPFGRSIDPKEFSFRIKDEKEHKQYCSILQKLSDIKVELDNDYRIYNMCQYINDNVYSNDELKKRIFDVKNRIIKNEREYNIVKDKFKKYESMTINDFIEIIY